MNEKPLNDSQSDTQTDSEVAVMSSTQQQQTSTTHRKTRRSYVDNQMHKLGLSVQTIKQILNETQQQSQQKQLTHHRTHRSMNTSSLYSSGSGGQSSSLTTSAQSHHHSSSSSQQHSITAMADTNPFKLVTCQQYANEAMAPFAIRLSMEALAIMDIHAHCVRTEVIGLLGGLYCARTQQLFVLTAEPCVSMCDHHLQCDMEPVSQALAKQSLEQKNYLVVGWYHSHPTFLPNPSLRDLETQHQFQSMFKSESNQPFIACILSPYHYITTTATTSSSSMSSCGVEYHSKFKCLLVSDTETIHHQQTVYRKPYELLPQIIRREKLMFSVTTKLKDLCEKIKENNSQSAIDLFDTINTSNSNNNRNHSNHHNINYLQKLCLSLRHYLLECGLSSVECDFMIDNCKTILCDHFKPSKHNNNTTTTTSVTNNHNNNNHNSKH